MPISHPGFTAAKQEQSRARTVRAFDLNDSLESHEVHQLKLQPKWQHQRTPNQYPRRPRRVCRPRRCVATGAGQPSSDVLLASTVFVVEVLLDVAFDFSTLLVVALAAFEVAEGL